MEKQYNSVIKKIVPIHRNELARFLCTAALMFLISYIYNALQMLNGALIISSLGAEYVSAIRLWVGLPSSLLLMILYIKLSDKVNRYQLFQIISWVFISYFILFAFVIYPHREVLSIDVFNTTILKLPSLKYLFGIISNWHYCLYAVFVENWGIVMFTISFWQIANHITTYNESKRFYPLFGVAAQIGMLLAGFISAAYITGVSWQLTLNNITISIAVAGIALSFCLMGLQNIIGYETFNAKHSHFKAKTKISIKDSLKYVTSSRPIFLITSLILCYFITAGLAAGSWEKSVEIFFHNDVNKMHHFFCKVNGYIAIFSMLCAFTGSYILRVCKWKTSVLITPIAVLSTGGIFFLVLLLRNSSFLLTLQSYISIAAVYFGTICIIFTMSTKHTFFDSTKEMIYIPLDDDLKTKGKAVAETVGARVGKTGGALIQQVLLALFPALNLMGLTPIIFVIFLIVSFLWLLILNRGYKDSTSQ